MENHLEKNFDSWERNAHGTSLNREENAWIIVGQILTIISAVFWCFTIIGMIWGIPMIIGCNQRLKKAKRITIMHIIISIIFYWLIGAILTLIGATQKNYL